MPPIVPLAGFSRLHGPLDDAIRARIAEKVSERERLKPRAIV